VKPPADEVDRRERFADLYQRDHPDVLRFVRRRSDPEMAEDVVHEVFLIAWRRFEVVPTSRDEARAWLFTTARNCMLSDARARTRRRELLVRIGDTATELAPEGVDPGFELDLVRAWQQLEPGHQEALALSIWEELSSPLAGQVLGISAAAYRLRLHRARTRLRTLLHTTAVDDADALTFNRKHA
jgi:RNA polymerase sigma-70 factor (ECF subfamily)